MGTSKTRWTAVLRILFVCFTPLFSIGAHAVLIDNFETDASARVTTAAPDTVAAPTPNDANMIGDRVITVQKTAGASGLVNAATGEAVGGLLGMANGPVTNSVITVDWTFPETDLTEGGTQIGILLSLPNPIDNDLDITFSINGGPDFSILFADGSSGDSFFFPFSGFSNSAEAETATSISVVFSNGLAWDAQVDFIATLGPPDRPTPKVPTMSVQVLGLTMLGLVLIAASRLSAGKSQRTRS